MPHSHQEASIYVFLLIGRFPDLTRFSSPARGGYPCFRSQKSSYRTKGLPGKRREDLDFADFGSQLSKPQKAAFQDCFTIRLTAVEYSAPIQCVVDAISPFLTSLGHARKSTWPICVLAYAPLRRVRKCYFFRASGLSREFREGRYSSSSRMRTKIAAVSTRVVSNGAQEFDARFCRLNFAKAWLTLRRSLKQRSEYFDNADWRTVHCESYSQWTRGVL